MSFDTEKLIKAMSELTDREITLMEVCGTHTMAIAKSGIKSILPKNIRLLSGPGCPVCVTPAGVIDAVLELAMRQDVIIASYGDMMRVPGSTPGDNLLRRRAMGADARIVYSAADAVELASENPAKQVVFLGAGFETTAPGTAAAILSAAEKNIENFSVFSMLKTVENALRKLISSEGFAVNGFICPGHVAVITGERGFEFLPRDYAIPAVIAGFEPQDILLSIYLLVKQLAENKPRVQNEYSRIVKPDGNPLALQAMEKVFEPSDAMWRGLGMTEGSGLKIRSEFEKYDAVKKLSLDEAAINAEKPTACRCGDVITGRIAPDGCPLFGRRCVPEDPVGPCMVSSEGACAAAYKYRNIR